MYLTCTFDFGLRQIFFNDLFYCQREQKMHMWLPFLLKIKIYKRMIMMIFTEHLVLRTYVFLCLGFMFHFGTL